MPRSRSSHAGIANATQTNVIGDLERHKLDRLEERIRGVGGVPSSFGSSQSNRMDTRRVSPSDSMNCTCDAPVKSKDGDDSEKDLLDKPQSSSNSSNGSDNRSSTVICPSPKNSSEESPERGNNRSIDSITATTAGSNSALETDGNSHSLGSASIAMGASATRSHSHVSASDSCQTLITAHTTKGNKKKIGNEGGSSVINEKSTSVRIDCSAHHLFHLFNN